MWVQQVFVPLCKANFTSYFCYYNGGDVLPFNISGVFTIMCGECGLVDRKYQATRVVPFSLYVDVSDKSVALYSVPHYIQNFSFNLLEGVVGKDGCCRDGYNCSNFTIDTK